MKTTEIKLTKDGKVTIGSDIAGIGAVTHKVVANKTRLEVSAGSVSIIHEEKENQKPGEGMYYQQPIVPNEGVSVNDIVEKFKPVM